MEKKFTEPTQLRPGGNRMLDAALVSIDLLHFIKQIKNEVAWQNSDRNAITVFKAENMRIVLVALKKGASMDTHTANGIISVQVLQGHIKFNTGKQSVELHDGQLLALHEKIPHSVIAIEETVFLLTLSVSPIVK